MTEPRTVSPPTAPPVPSKAPSRLKIMTSPGPGLNRVVLLRGLVITLVVLAAGLAVPYIVLDRFYIGILFDGLVLSLLAVSIGFLARYLGLISLGHTAFYGGSAYAVGIGISKWGWPPLTAAIVAIVFGTALAAVMGLLVVRMSGMSFLMLTLALGQALYQLSIQQVAIPWTGAYDGLQITFAADDTFLGFTPREMASGGVFWPVAWVSLVLIVFALWTVGRSRFGIVMEGVRENEERMRFSGFNTFAPRLVAFVISGFVASVAGVIFALNAAYVSPETLSFLKAGDALTAAIIGGLGTLLGPILGGFIYIGVQTELNAGGNLHLYMGIILVAVLMFLPGGITGGLSRLWRRRRKQPQAVAAREDPFTDEVAGGDRPEDLQ